MGKCRSKFKDNNSAMSALLNDKKYFTVITALATTQLTTLIGGGFAGALLHMWTFFGLSIVLFLAIAVYCFFGAQDLDVYPTASARRKMTNFLTFSTLCVGIPFVYDFTHGSWHI